MSLLALLLALIFGMPDKSADAAEEAGAPREQRRILSVPWPMYCNFIVRVIEGPGERVVVAAKRDCD